MREPLFGGGQESIWRSLNANQRLGIFISSRVLSFRISSRHECIELGTGGRHQMLEVHFIEVHRPFEFNLNLM